MLSVVWLLYIVDIALFHISNLILYKADVIFVLEWMDALIKRYFYNNSWSEMVITQMNPVGEMIVIYSQNDARSDVKCGLAALHSRYSFIPYK